MSCFPSEPYRYLILHDMQPRLLLFLCKVLVEAVEVMVDEETTTVDGETVTTFNSLETKITALLQDAIGGTPSVDMTATSNDVRSELTVELELAWGFEEFAQMYIDLDDMTNSGDGLSGDILHYIKTLIPGEAEAMISVETGVAFRLGVGLEFVRDELKINPYIKGNSGLFLHWKSEATAAYEATIGPLRGTIEAQASITGTKEYDPLSLSVGLDKDLNYYMFDPGSVSQYRAGFKKVNGIGGLIDEVGLKLDGRVHAEIAAGLPLLGSFASIGANVSDVGAWLGGDASAFTFGYRIISPATGVPSLLDILLLEPDNVVDVFNEMAKLVEAASLGPDGVVTKLFVPFMSNSMSEALGAGTDNNVIGRGRRSIVSFLRGELAAFEGEKVSRASHCCDSQFFTFRVLRYLIFINSRQRLLILLRLS